MEANAALVGSLVLGLVLLIPGLAAVAGIFVWVGKISTKAESASRRSHDLANELASFKVEVAKDYATKELLKEFKREIVEAIAGLSARIDHFLQPPK
jgi:hypothetical protein